MANPYENEVAFISGLDSANRVAGLSYDTKAADSQGHSGQSEIYSWAASGLPGTGVTLKYWFVPGNWDAAEEKTFTDAMEQWSNVANVKFEAATSAGAASFSIYRDLSIKTAEWGAPPQYAAIGASVLPILAGSSTQNFIRVNDSPSGIGPITDNFQTAVHELGHTLGLGHGGWYNFSDSRSNNYGPDQFSAYDTMLWTTMSYISPEDSRARFFDAYPVSNTSWNSQAPLTAMPLDILAAQRLYGLPTTGPLLSGNATFGFNSTVGGYYSFQASQQYVLTLWDGGTHNALDLSGYGQDAVIDLHPGNFSSAGGLRNNIGIAFGTVIETGIGGAGNDWIYASDVNSTLRGNAGNDVLIGGAGDDVLVGGPGRDLFDGGGGRNILRDTLADHDGDRVLHFGFSTTIDILDALVGRDHLKVIDTPQVGTTLVMGNTSIDLAGHFGGGEFLAVARNVGSGPHTEVTFVPYLPQLVEGRHVDPGAINGIASQLFMTGDGVVSFKATLQAAVSAFPNTLGWYKVGTDGTIAGVHVLYANTQAPGAVTVDLGTPANGEKVAFFLVENGFGQFGVLPDNLSFVKADGVTPGNANQVGTLSLHSATLGTLNAAIFHTVANLNPGQAQQVLSGAMPGGHDLVLSFEDTAAAVGDNDFQDVVMSVHASRDDVYYLL